MTTSSFRPAADDAAIARARDHYRRHGFVRLEPAVAPADAEALFAWLTGEAEWWRVLNQGEDKVFELGPEAQAALEADPARAEALEAAIRKGARDGFQFIYDTVRTADSQSERQARGWPVDQLVEALNSERWLALFRHITGADDAVMVDGQATRYLPGHFLTAHSDEVEGKGRRAAYVLGLTPSWRVEWGGLLMFHGADGDVARALMPRFNTITLFSVPNLHSVSSVAAAAGGPRFSVTGWLRSAV